jgi:hypothetical protein
MRTFMLLAGMALMAPQDSGRLVVHEWGTFTSVSGRDGVMLDWRPLEGPVDLPKFVYGTGSDLEPPSRRTPRGWALSKGDLAAPVRMETPVLYFYSDRARELSVNVRFPKGQITEWYPSAVSLTGGIDWGKIRVLPKETPEFPVERAPSHYYPARDTDADPVRTDTTGVPQYEKFLFYRGVGWFSLPVQVLLHGSRVTVKNTGKEAFPGGFLFERRGSKAGYRAIGRTGSEVTVERPDLNPEGPDLGAELERALTGEGLYEKEARAMVKTWRDSWFEEGLRLIYILPRRYTDSVLPLEIAPAADSLVRVLVGRCEVVTPEMEESMIALVKRLSDPSAVVRDSARKDLGKFGRFTGPVLIRASRITSEPEVKARIRQLLEKN